MSATVVRAASLTFVPATATSRRCTRSGCAGTAVATLTYSYADRQAVLGSLALSREPGAYDLCRVHAENMSTPVGWELIRLPLDVAPVGPTEDDLEALARIIREVGLRHDEPLEPVNQPMAPGIVALDDVRRRRRAGK